MPDPFILLHTNVSSFWYRASAIISIDTPIRSHGVGWARSIINNQGSQRFVLETPAQVHAAIGGDPFIVLHNGTDSFWYRASAIVSVDEHHDVSTAWARCIINADRLVKESLDEVRKLLTAKGEK